MALQDLLNLVNEVTITKTISTNDGMGGTTSTSSITTLPLAAIWNKFASNKFFSDKYSKDSTDMLCFEYGAYTFDPIVASSSSSIETISYNGATYKRNGFCNDVMQLHEIMTQEMERIS